MGIDEPGRDVLLRMLHGRRPMLALASGGAATGLILGGTPGPVPGLGSGCADGAIQSVVGR